MYKIIPLDDRILIELEPVDSKKVGSLFVSEKHSEKIRIGTVIAAGDKAKFKVGDKIMVSWWTGTIVYLYENRWTNDCHRILRDEEVLARVEE